MYNLQFIWLPSTHSIINFTDPFYTLAWLTTVQMRGGETVPPYCHRKVPGWHVTWPICRQSCCCRGDRVPFPFSFCPHLLPAFPIPVHENLHGGSCPGNEPCSAHSALVPQLPHPSGMQQVAHLANPRCAGGKAKVSQGEVSRTKGRKQAFSPSHQCLPSPLRSRTEESGKNTGIAHRRLSAHDPGPNIISQKQDKKTGGKDSRSQQNTCCWGFISTVPLFFPLWGICTVA